MRNRKTGRLFFAVLILFALFPSSLLYADLGDFSRSVNEGRQENEPEEKKKKEREFHEDHEDDESRNPFFFLAALLWYYHNRSSCYAEYPYENGSDRPAAIAHDERLLLGKTAPDRKQSRWILSSSGGMFFEGTDIGGTANFRLNGIVGGVVGPEFEYRLWKDESSILHMYRAGGVLPLIQSDYFSLSLDLSGVFFRDALSLNAVALGGSVVSYPFRPISLEIRGGAVLSESAAFSELGIRLGAHMNRFEVYAGYYGLFYDDTGLENQTKGLNVAEFGTAVHF